MKIIKQMKYGIGFCFFLVAFNVAALDVVAFNKIANDTIKQMNSGVVGDIDSLIAMQEQLMVLGMEGGIDYLQENPKDAQALIYVIENAEKMKALSLEEIEDLWHGGNYLRGKGINPEDIDHFGPTMSLMDSVIHPATSYLLIQEYKRTGNTDLLARVKGELFEVLEHIKHVKQAPAASPMQVTLDQ